MTPLFVILVFASLYAVSIMGDRKGTLCYLGALLLHLGYIIFRSVRLEQVPVTNTHDILIMMSFLAALSFLYLYFRKKVENLMNVLPFLPFTLSILAVFYERMDTISPNMNSIWFYLYMILFIAGFSLMGIGSVLGLMYLKKQHSEVEGLQYRFTLAGWLLFSCSLIAGSVWFYLAHGVYWLWTAKELWTTIVWFYYSFYLHARLLNSLKGQFAAEFGAAGFLVMLFSYLGVTPILGSPWTQF